MKKRFVCWLLVPVLIAATILPANAAFRFPTQIRTACELPPAGERIVDASSHGLSPDRKGLDNSKILQRLINNVSREGGVIYIPAGEYEFAQISTQTIGSHCIKMRSNVTIRGAGEKTVLKPVGASEKGLEMFYFNKYLDTGEAVYLENCRFEDFVIDAAGTSCETYTSAGKGFMFNLFRNCHWARVTVKNTDATGFGVDCPIDSSIVNCVAINCGKAANTASAGASGFGIGFGYSEEESMLISDCRSIGNRKFGFFFEHQGRFNAVKYAATDCSGFAVKNCTAEGNLYNFGGIRAINTTYENCISVAPRGQGFYFERSENCAVLECTER